MEPGQPEAKRPRLSAPSTSTWTTASHQGPVLPPPQPAHPHPHTLSPFQSHNIYSRQEPLQPHPAHHPDDRRHHEQEPYPPPPPPPPPMQDQHRQPPPSPIHAPPYPSYHRESIVKRESGEDVPLPHMRRPNSTGNVPDGISPHPPGPPPLYTGQHPDDHRRPPSFDNGVSMPQSPQLYRPPQQSAFHPPPTPIAQHTQYDTGPAGYGPTPSVSDMYSTVPISSAKRKAQRASQACDSCRQLKAKCDEQRPCRSCKDKGTPCIYRDLPTKQPDKVSSDILDLMSALKNQITHEFGRMDARMTKIEYAMKISDPSSGMKVESVEEDNQEYVHSPSNMKDSQDEVVAPEPTELPEEEDSSVQAAPGLDRTAFDKAQNILREMEEDEVELQPGSTVVPGQPSMPADHTTLAALLLEWPSIKHICEDLIAEAGIQHIKEFPIRQEQQRGVLRVFGRGEGFDQEIRPATAKNDHQPQQVMTDVGDEFSDAASPLPGGDAWGQVGTINAPDVVKNGSLYSDGIPDFDRAKVNQYVASFKENILNMHPILIPGQLDAMVTIFLDSLPPQLVKTVGKGSAKFVQPTGPDPGTKRKRSPAGDEQTPTIAYQKAGHPFRSIHSALVLAVLALGKICLHKGKIPDFVPEQEPSIHNSPSVRNGVLSSPSQGSPPGLTPAQASGLPSPKEHERSLSSRRPSLQGSAPPIKGQPMRRNMDLIPGLDYFGLAADIFGSHLGGYTLKHVYVALFLGLYHGQLGRVLESWSYINLAGRTLQVILRPSLSRLRASNEAGKLPISKRDNQLAFAFWTCLQLESDILAELPVPHSGILGFERHMPYPELSKHVNEGYTQDILSSYQAQLYLRKQLNEIHNNLYNSNANANANANASASMHSVIKTTEEKLKDIQYMLKDGRERWVPSGFYFSDYDPPATEILAARLRAKYWGSQTILYRPYIDLILHQERIPDHHFSSAAPPPERWAAEGIHLEGIRVPHGMDPRALHYARLGVSALVESTRAFHGLNSQHRLQVTNVFTTAHAQWGNLLVLAACHWHHVLNQFIQRDLLQELFNRTIEFFKLISHATSPLSIDLRILEGVAAKFNFHQTDTSDQRTGSSFSSNTSGPGQTPNDIYHPGTPVMPPPPHHVS